MWAGKDWVLLYDNALAHQSLSKQQLLAKHGKWWIQGFYSSGYEEFYLLGYTAM
jgi:hypothetical protein